MSTLSATFNDKQAKNSSANGWSSLNGESTDASGWSSLDPSELIAEEPEEIAGPVRPYNAQQAFIVVDIGDHTPTRGDAHGATGIAKYIAAQTGGRFDIISRTKLAELYPEHREESHEKLRELYFRDHGNPDFYLSFGAMGGHPQNVVMNIKGASGLVVVDTNEAIPGRLGMTEELVPHHLTQEKLASEGKRFVETFKDLPRPFIGINLIDDYKGPIKGKKTSGTEMAAVAEKLTALKAAYKEATFFVCSCHRTHDPDLSFFLRNLRSGLSDVADRFSVVEFDYKKQVKEHGNGKFWNPYAGMLASCDHIVQVGASYSMVSETLAAGKKPHVMWGKTRYKNCSIYLEDCLPGQPLVTPAMQPFDITEKCAQELISKHTAHKDKAFRRPTKTKSYDWIS